MFTNSAPTNYTQNIKLWTWKNNITLITFCHEWFHTVNLPVVDHCMWTIALILNLFKFPGNLPKQTPVVYSYSIVRWYGNDWPSSCKRVTLHFHQEIWSQKDLSELTAILSCLGWIWSSFFPSPPGSNVGGDQTKPKGGVKYVISLDPGFLYLTLNSLQALSGQDIFHIPALSLERDKYLTKICILMKDDLFSGFM